jgi:hypothetical protein
MLWLIKKGETIIPGEPTEEKIEINRHFTKKDITARELSSVTLVVCKSDKVADRLSDLSQESKSRVKKVHKCAMGSSLTAATGVSRYCYVPCRLHRGRDTRIPERRVGRGGKVLHETEILHRDNHTDSTGY